MLKKINVHVSGKIIDCLDYLLQIGIPQIFCILRWMLVDFRGNYDVLVVLKQDAKCFVPVGVKFIKIVFIVYGPTLYCRTNIVLYFQH